MSDTSAGPAQQSAPVRTGSGRLMSLDALRGFDMFWIVGGEEIFHALYKASPNALTGLLHRQLEHKAWAGLAFYDLIFPLFVFLVGASIVFSLSRTIEQLGKAQALKRIIIRSLFLYIFGLLVYGGLSKGFDQIRWLGVLQRIAICYLFTGLIFCAFRLRGMLVLCATLLIGYWALVSFVPIRNFNLETHHLEARNLQPKSPETREAFYSTTEWVRGRFDDGLNLTQHLDYQYLPGYKWDGAYDPEGLLSNFPATATCLLGVLAGLLLRNPSVSGRKKVLWLAVTGIACVLAGFAWGIQFPVIKKIWTSSYVLVAAGYACLFLAAFYEIVEIRGWRKWCIPFVWIGMNPITIYLAAHFIRFSDIAELLVGGPVKSYLRNWGDFAVALVAMTLVFAFLRFLYQKKIFLRV